MNRTNAQPNRLCYNLDSSIRFLVSLATELLEFGNRMLDGFVAGCGLRDVNRAAGGKLGDEPAIVGFPRLAMRDDGCPADAEVGHEVCRRNLLFVVVKALADGDSEFDFFVGVHGV